MIMPACRGEKVCVVEVPQTQAPCQGLFWFVSDSRTEGGGGGQTQGNSRHDNNQVEYELRQVMMHN